MIGPAPRYSWDNMLIYIGELPVANLKWRERGDPGYALMALPEDAPDSVKMDYEKFQRRSFGSLARFYVPDMKAPYYTWEGKVVERSSLKDRTLPLADADYRALEEDMQG